LITISLDSSTSSLFNLKLMLNLYKLRLISLYLTCVLLSPGSWAQTITTVAGSGIQGFCGDNGPATAACLDDPYSVSLDFNGNFYIADAFNHCVRKVNAAGIITTIAGTGIASYSGNGGQATLAGLNMPSSVAVDFFGNIFIADAGNHVIRKINTSGIISTVAGNNVQGFSGDNGPATLASLNGPSSVFVDFSGNLYIADLQNNRVRMVSGVGSQITTIAGNGTAAYTGNNGPATSASLNHPSSVVMDMNGNIFIADEHNHAIRKVDLSGIITTVAGNGTPGYSGNNGPATSAQLNFPFGVAVDATDNIFIADMSNHVVRKVTPAGIISTYAGNGTIGFSGDNGPATSAMLWAPVSVAILGTGDLYLTDANNYRIRKVSNCSTPLQPASITGSAVICPGNQYTYTIQPLANATSYTWTLPAGWTGASNTTSITVTAPFGGTISVAGTNSCGNGVAQTLTVLPFVQPAIAPSGPVSICGGSITLSASPAGATSYQWLLNNVSIPGATASNYTTSAVGNYTVIVSTNNCTDTSNPVVVSLGTAPVATVTTSGPTTFCQGNSVILTANSVTGNTYQWMQNNAIIPGAGTAAYTANAAGSYTVIVTNNGCSDTSTPVVVTVNPLPVVAITQAGSTFTATGGFSSYQWYLNGTAITGATSNTFVTTQAGSYYVIVSDSNCQKQSNTVVVLSIVGADNASSTISLFPNPNDGEFRISGHVGSGNEEITICVSDIFGKVVSREHCRALSGKIDYKYTMPKTASSGLYILKVTSQGLSTSMQFQKKW
jgi:hypothetical protein